MEVNRLVSNHNSPSTGLTKADVGNNSRQSLNRNSDIPFIDEDRFEHVVLLHSDTGFDSSTDETVVPYTAEERQSLEIKSCTSIEKFEPGGSPDLSRLSRVTRRSGDTDLCGTLYEESTEVDPSIYPKHLTDLKEMGRTDEIQPESERLVGTSLNVKPASKSHPDYRVGSCYHCIVSVPLGSLLAFILLFISTVGWAVATWLSIYKGRQLLGRAESDDDLAIEEICIIVISVATVLLSVIFLLVATCSSEKMSRYAFNTGKKNVFGYCLSVTEIIFSSIGAMFWTGIVGLTMIPIGALTIIHLLVGMTDLNCVHLPSYGVAYSYPSTTPEMTTMTTTTVQAENSTISNSTGIAVSNTTNSYTSASMQTPVSMQELLCGDELHSWFMNTWQIMVPLLTSLAFAVAVELALIGFLIASSSNARHLRERMRYINEPYAYSSDNVNGNVKPVTQESANNNLQLNDTQI